MIWHFSCYIFQYHSFSLDDLKVSSRWVPRILNPEQKACRQQFSDDNLDMLRPNSENVFKGLLRGMKHGSIMVQSSRKSPQWKHKGSLNPKKFRVQQSAGKIMATVFWDSEGVLLLEFMPHKTTITGDTYASTVFTREYQTETPRRAVESCRLVSCCLMTMHPHTNHAHRGLL